jgi:predicted P-loop ATPase
MDNNKKIIISIGNSRRASIWTKTEMYWSEFIDKLKTPARSTESYKDYMALSKARQDELKDVGGYVGGSFRGDRRKACYVEGRDLLTLDLDNIPAGETDAILKRVSGLGCAAAVYSTRKHSPFTPRLRVVIPLDRTATPDEYEPACRKVAGMIGIDLCDPTTFEASRLMYWPSCSADAVYVCEAYDNPFCSLDGLLGLYSDWRDVTEWPQVPGADAAFRRHAARQEDPTGKKGIVGAFCRVYTITHAMDKFIPGIYEPTSMERRYTYVGGSTAGGAVVYDNDTFLFSHHATDPCSGQLVNAFDMVRLHKYGDQDDDIKDGTPASRMPSYLSMKRLALEDDAVADLMNQERLENARNAFENAGEGVEDGGPDFNFNWMTKLTKDQNGNPEKTINNAVIVLENDPFVRGKIAFDEFASCCMVLGELPWDKRDVKRRWCDADDAGYYRYMETFYHITGREKLDNAMCIVSSSNRINDVKAYLESLKWDGVRRLDTLLADYLGAEDTKYTRAVMRKSLVAAVARAVTGAVKYDYMPIITGRQGIGKSTFLSLLGKDWFSDSLVTFEGKEAAEMIQGTWINEVGELTAMSKQEVTSVKQFLSKQYDIYRAAYGRHTEKYPRRCVFFGTSNETEFLKDSTGNRRFWPVDTGIYPAKKSVWKDLPGEVDQIWAEAYVRWQFGEPLYLDDETELMAQKQQDEHRETSSKEGLIRDYIEKDVPSNWDKLDVQARRMFLNGGLVTDCPMIKRRKICAMEIWVELFGGDPKFLKRADSKEINSVLELIPGWKKVKSTGRFGPYGIQKGFERV